MSQPFLDKGYNNENRLWNQTFLPSWSLYQVRGETTKQKYTQENLICFVGEDRGKEAKEMKGVSQRVMGGCLLMYM